MRNLFSTKQVLVFDPTVFTKGAFFTYSIMSTGDDGQLEDNSLYVYNGIIREVEENYFTFIHEDGATKKLTIEQVYKGDDQRTAPQMVKILGVRRTVAEGRE